MKEMSDGLKHKLNEYMEMKHELDSPHDYPKIVYAVLQHRRLDEADQVRIVGIFEDKAEAIKASDNWSSFEATTNLVSVFLNVVGNPLPGFLIT